MKHLFVSFIYTMFACWRPIDSRLENYTSQQIDNIFQLKLKRKKKKKPY